MTTFSGVGSPGAIASASGGKTTPIAALGTSLVAIIAARPQRRNITFHNPGAVDIYVAMAKTATGAANTPSLAAPAGAFRIFSGGQLTIEGECQDAWNGFAASAGGQLTIMESNV